MEILRIVDIEVIDGKFSDVNEIDFGGMGCKDI